MKKRRQIEKLKIKIPIYNSVIDFRLGKLSNLKNDIFKDYSVQLVDNNLDEAGGAAFNLEREYKVPNVLLVAVGEFWEYRLSIGLSLVMHEIIHAVNMMLSNRGLGTSEDDDENLAYISAYVFELFLKEIKLDDMLKQRRKS